MPWSPAAFPSLVNQAMTIEGKVKGSFINLFLNQKLEPSLSSDPLSSSVKMMEGERIRNQGKPIVFQLRYSKDLLEDLIASRTIYKDFYLIRRMEITSISVLAPPKETRAVSIYSQGSIDQCPGFPKASFNSVWWLKMTESLHDSGGPTQLFWGHLRCLIYLLPAILYYIE